MTELYIFGMFLVLDGKESAFEAASRLHRDLRFAGAKTTTAVVVTLRLRSGQVATRAEAGCVGHAQRELAETVHY